MPFDAAGNYSLPSGYQAENGLVIQPSQHNAPLEDIRGALSSVLLRSGAAPMTGPLKLTSGTVALPGLSFNSSTGTGLYKTDTGFAAAVNGAKVAEFGPYGMTYGAVPIGLGPLPWSGTTAPVGWVLAAGQSLSRTTYAALWAFAQAEIAAGNTLYTDGNGTTTFTVADMRGRGAAGKDDMGGSAASRLTSTTMTPDGNTLGASGGAQTVLLSKLNLPNTTFEVTIPSGQGSHNHVTGMSLGPGQNASFVSGGDANAGQTQISTSTQTLPAMSGTAASGGSGTAINKVQPTLITNFIIFAGA